jgi:hypothetical protein
VQFYLCTPFSNRVEEVLINRKHSSAGSEHLPYKQRVRGSNPCASTSFFLNWKHSSAGSEHLPYKQRVRGSNPCASTSFFLNRKHSSAGSEHLPYKQRVRGSNPCASTTFSICVAYATLFFCPNFSSPSFILSATNFESSVLLVATNLIGK